ncbi:MAG TPA: hypothetical protein VFX89_17920 [Gammaproteobacteria bacterium]|nr:hypothetical protein [Gammaproteobacteria bacterium]
MSLKPPARLSAAALASLKPSSCGAVDTSTAGWRELTCTARNRAGSAATASLSYTVEGAASSYPLVARCWPQPGTRIEHDSALQIEVAVVDGNGRPLPDATASDDYFGFAASRRLS